MNGQTETQNPKSSWGLSVWVKDRTGANSFQRMVVKLDLDDSLSAEKDAKAKAEASDRVYNAIMANESLRRYHRPELVNGELYLTNPILNTREKVLFETVLIIE